jgi:hypothetical protein
MTKTKDQIQKILELKCICGHSFIKHAEYVGLGCGFVMSAGAGKNFAPATSKF